jgi:ferredoxin--NADP+ reductase
MSKANLYRAQLIERVNFTEDLGLFRFRPDTPVNFRPGQYATLAVEVGGELIQRPYSIVSSPHEPFLEFFIELVPQGELTVRLWDLKVGDEVLIRKRVVGSFTLETEGGRRRHLMAATVTGVAPFVSMARAQRFELRKGQAVPHQFAIIQGASHSRELGLYREELDEIAREGWLTYVPTVSRPWEDANWTGETGRVEDVFRKHADQLGFTHDTAVGYACGHPQMIENVKGLLARAGFAEEHVKAEKFFSPPKA